MRPLSSAHVCWRLHWALCVNIPRKTSLREFPDHWRIRLGVLAQTQSCRRLWDSLGCHWLLTRFFHLVYVSHDVSHDASQIFSHSMSSVGRQKTAWMANWIWKKTVHQRIRKTKVEKSFLGITFWPVSFRTSLRFAFFCMALMEDPTQILDT